MIRCAYCKQDLTQAIDDFKGGLLECPNKLCKGDTNVRKR